MQGLQPKKQGNHTRPLSPLLPTHTPEGNKPVTIPLVKYISEMYYGRGVDVAVKVIKSIQSRKAI